MKKKIVIVAAILATAAALVGFTNKHETVVTEDSVIIPAETGARVIIQYPDGNVYEFIGNDYDIMDTAVIVYFDKDF